MVATLAQAVRRLAYDLEGYARFKMGICSSKFIEQSSPCRPPHNITMQGLRKDNHYVPKLYLKQWASDNEIPTYRLLVPHEKLQPWKSHSLSGIAFHEHLYTRVLGGEATDEFERWLHEEFENPIDAVIGRAVREERLSPGDWNLLIRFAVAQDVRTPAYLLEFLTRQSESLPALLDETVEDCVKNFQSRLKDHNVSSDPPEDADLFPLKVTVQRYPEGDGGLKAEIVVGRSLWLWNIRRILTSTIKKLPKKGWTILHAPDGLEWPTSDNPLIRLNFKSEAQYDFKGGWGVLNGDILLPLSPKHLLCTCIGNRARLRGTTLDIPTAQMIQRFIVEHAHRYVFSRKPFDVHTIRPRVVSVEAYKREKDAWDRWGREQGDAEAELRVRPAHSQSRGETSRVESGAAAQLGP